MPFKMHCKPRRGGGGVSLAFFFIQLCYSWGWGGEKRAKAGGKGRVQSQESSLCPLASQVSDVKTSDGIWVSARAETEPAVNRICHVSQQ